mgnify:FL=1|jgi:hypothetical protein
MIIKSMAGDFEISIAEFEVEGPHLVMVGTMGVWNARTYMSPRELLGVFAKMLRPSVLLYLITIPFRALAEGPGEKKPTDDNAAGGTS